MRGLRVSWVQPGRIQSMTSLQEQLNFFVTSTATSPELTSALQRDFKPSSVQPYNDTRKTMNLSIRDQQRLNAENYHAAFRLSRGTSLQDEAFKHADMLVTTYGLILNCSAFLVSIELLGNEEQVRYWQEQVLQGKVMGAYGQTELGHGSNVKQLETTATYDPASQTFTITSPTITSAKFWPGVLGQYCTHSVIQARTIVGGKDIGVQTFVVELRDAKLQPVGKVELFDIGPKLGFERIDNGGVIFKGLSVPRGALLARYVRVTPEGQVEGLENKQAIKYGYGSMLNLRVKLTYNFAIRGILAPAIVFHSLLEAEGTANLPDNRSFVTEALCTGLGLTIANKHPHQLFNQLLKAIAEKNYVQADKLLVSCHIISSTFKAISSRMAVDFEGQAQTRSSLAKFRTSLLPFYFLNYIPSATYEGDNTVLLQQTSKYLLFKFKLDRTLPSPPTTFAGDDWQAASVALEHILVERLKRVKARMESTAEKGTGFQTIWNELEQNALIEASVLWGHLTLLQSMATILPTIKENQDFFRKVCRGFTSFLTARTDAFLLHGFTVQPVESWKLFSEEEFSAMLSVTGPVRLPLEAMQLVGRQEQWFQAKL